ncbi:MAG: CDP-alcohol phosphatidyltransferase family protein [Acidobacteria bacterium]|nr:CDP-alcohol phosphatidyltransferase family protein [Acidobacteriota bacterium]
MSANTTHGHVREHGSLLAQVEKRTLVWIAERLPRAVNSDHLSILGLAGMALAGAAFWASHRFDAALVVVVAALAVNWFGDSLDGTLARVRNQQRPMYGFYVDHVIDVAGAVLLFGGLGLSPYMTLEVALALTVAYLMISAEAYLATHARGVFRMAMFKVGPTELRILLAFGTLYLYYKPRVVLAGSEYLLFDVGGVVATAGMVGAFVLSAVRNTLALYRAEPVPRADRPQPRERRAPAAGDSTGDERAAGSRRMRSRALVSATLLALTVGGIISAVAPASAAELHPRTVTAWNDYVASTEQRIARELAAGGDFLVQDFDPAAEAVRRAVLEGEVPVTRMRSHGPAGRKIDVPKGAIHHWRGSIFVPGVTLDGVLDGVRSPLRQEDLQEDVIESRVLERAADRVRVFLKLRRKKLVTVHFNTEHEMRYARHAAGRASSRSVATRIAELEDAGTPDEREKPVGVDRGFLWRLNSYWRYEEVAGGVIVECESITLSRSVPSLVRWMVKPLIESAARESMERTLTSLRERLIAGAGSVAETRVASAGSSGRRAQ